MGTLFRDIRYGFRMQVKSPAFTLIGVLVLGLGIGATTAIFSVVHSVLWRPLPVPHAERLVGVWESNPEKGQIRMGVSPPNFLDWEEQADVFDGIAAFAENSFVLTGRGQPKRCKGLAVTEGYFRLAGISPELGRIFYERDTIAGSDPVVIISHKLWQTSFGGDAKLIGQPIILNDKSYTLVGVLPEDYFFDKETQLWIPLALGSKQTPGMRGARYLHVMARLKEGITITQAEEQMCRLEAQIADKDPINRGWSVQVIGLQDQMTESVRPSLLALLGGAGLLLLTACANITNLLIVRITNRRNELSIQRALGATRLNLLRQLLIENLTLALLGGAFGIFIASCSISIITEISPWNIPRLEHADMSAWGFSFGVLLSLLVGLVCGILSVGGALTPDIAGSIKNNNRTSSGTAWTENLRRFLVITETAFSIILLIVAGLLSKSFWSLKGIDPGFAPEKTYTMTISLPTTRYSEPHQQSSFFKELLSRVQNIPGVTQAGLVTNLPFSGSIMTFGYKAYDRSSLVGEQDFAQYHAISPDYFKAMGIELLSGRCFTEQDHADGHQVVIINTAMAKQLWGDAEVVGQRIGLANEGMRAREIVGVVENVKHKGLDSDIVPEAYVPFEQNPWSFMTLVARSRTVTQSLAATLREQLWALDRNLPADSIVSLEHLIDRSLAPMRFRTLLVGLFGIASVFLAAIGLYAMVSYTNGRRTREFGIRLALGAKANDVLSLVLIQGLKLSVMGIAVGLIMSWLLTRIIRSLLYGISPTDPVVFLLAAFLLMGIALLACAAPARKAAKTDPMEALRYE